MIKNLTKEKRLIKAKTSNKGITLIALVITIIVLLILAGVSIATLIGENGILTQAEEAKTLTEDEAIFEQLKLAYSELQIAKSTNSNLDTLQYMKESIGKFYGTENISITGSSEMYNLEFNGSNKVYKLKSNGITDIYEKMAPTNIFAKLNKDEKTLHLRSTFQEGYEKLNLYDGIYQISKQYNIENIHKVVIEEIIAPFTTRKMFRDCTNLQEIVNIEKLHTENVISMAEMFRNTAINNLNLSSFYTAKVESMYCMFAGCSSLISLDIEGFDMGNVNDITYMFLDCKNLKNLNLGNSFKIPESNHTMTFARVSSDIKIKTTTELKNQIQAISGNSLKDTNFEIID